MKYLKLIASFTFFGVIALSQNNEIKSYVAGEDPLLDANKSNMLQEEAFFDNEVETQISDRTTDSLEINIIDQSFVKSSKNKNVKVMSTETVTFTNASATGREGPNQTQINSAYSGSNLASKVTINTQGVQEWTVPATTVYTIDAYGAQGGNRDAVGGKGARIKGDFSLNKDDVIYILVGQKGLDSDDRNYNYGGRSKTNSGGGGVTIGGDHGKETVEIAVPFFVNALK